MCSVHSQPLALGLASSSVVGWLTPVRSVAASPGCLSACLAARLSVCPSARLSLSLLGWIGLGWSIGLGGIGLNWIGLGGIGLDWVWSDWVGLGGIGLDWDCLYAASDCRFSCFFPPYVASNGRFGCVAASKSAST